MELISKHLPLSLPTFEHHLRQEHKNIRSTKKIATKDKLGAEATPTQEPKTKDCFFSLATKEAVTTYSDLTGIYPIISSRGNQ